MFPNKTIGSATWFWGAEQDQPFRTFVESRGWMNRHVYASYHMPPPPSGAWMPIFGPRTIHHLEDGREVTVIYMPKGSEDGPNTVHIDTDAPPGHHLANRMAALGEKRRKRIAKRRLRTARKPHQDA